MFEFAVCAAGWPLFGQNRDKSIDEADPGNIKLCHRLNAGDTGVLRAGTAYCIAYMRALLRRSNEEVG
jgi:hypothetical protein